MEMVNVKGGKRLNEKENVERRQRRKGRIKKEERYEDGERKRKKEMKGENIEEGNRLKWRM